LDVELSYFSGATRRSKKKKKKKKKEYLGCCGEATYLKM